MTMAEQLALLAVLLQLVGMTGAAVWSVATIKSTTANLKTTINNLAETVEKLSNVITTIEEKTHNHETRLTVLEKQFGNHFLGGD